MKSQLAFPAGIAASDVWIDTPDGRMECIVARPEKAGAVDAIIMYPHVGGLTTTMRRMAMRAAAGGYLCVVPNLYHRIGTIVIDPESHDEKVVAIRKIAAASVTGAGAMADTRGLLDWLAQAPDVRRAARGAIGYGRSGSLALLAAGTYPGEIPAAASVLGFNFVADEPMSAHRTLDRIKEVYCAFAEHDDIISPDTPRELASLLKASPVESELVIHPGARHPYAFPDRLVYDAAAAESDWRKIFAMFARHLSMS